MKLYVLKAIAPQASNWDVNDGFVVRANRASDARLFASRKAGDEGADYWLSEEKSSCEPLKAEGRPGVILSDFHAG